MFYIDTDLKKAFSELCEIEGAYMAERLRDLIVRDLGEWGLKHGLSAKEDSND